jgi:8-oxo-dGTP pyrophosphatase MutT (NUDIX family)
MHRLTRYQGAIIRDHQILLLTHQERASGRTYWVIPGGGMEPGESPEECVRREMQEETGLEVRVLRIIVEEQGVPDVIYTNFHTYLCEIISGEAAPGYEPEPEAAALYAIQAVGWFDLPDPLSWGPAVHSDRFTYPLLLRIRQALGYSAVPGDRAAQADGAAPGDTVGE